VTNSMTRPREAVSAPRQRCRTAGTTDGSRPVVFLPRLRGGLAPVGEKIGEPLQTAHRWAKPYLSSAQGSPEFAVETSEGTVVHQTKRYSSGAEDTADPAE